MDMRNHASAFEGWAPPWYDETSARPIFERYDLDFFRRWTSTVPSTARLVGNTIAAKRRAGSEVFPWLGDPKLAVGDLPFLLARATQSEEDISVLMSVLSSMVERKARVFSTVMRDAERGGVILLAKARAPEMRHMGKGVRKEEASWITFLPSPIVTSPSAADVVFTTLLEAGPGCLDVLLSNFHMDDRCVEGLAGDEYFVDVLHPWLVSRYPRFEDKAKKKAVQAVVVREKVRSENDQFATKLKTAQLEQQIVDLRQETTRLQALVDTTTGLLHLAESEKAEQVEEMRSAWAQVLQLQKENLDLRTMGIPTEPLPEALPTNYDDFEAWAQTAMAGRLVVLPRALRTTKKSRSVDISRLVKAVVFLRDVYVPMRRGSEEAKARYQEALTESGFDESQSLSDKASYEGLPGYYVDWNGRKFALDRHLKRGKGTDIRSMIRIYFTWDEEAQVVIVGHMPTHLEIWSTN
jgi:hypothetical protein